MNKRIDLTEIPLNHLAREIIITFDAEIPLNHLGREIFIKFDVWCELNELLYEMIFNELKEIEEQINEQQN